MKARIYNNIIKNVFDGSDACIPREEGDIIIEVPYGFLGIYDQDIRMWDSTGNLLPEEESRSKGYLKPTQKIYENRIVDKSLQEQYDEGLYIPEAGFTVYHNKLWDRSKFDQYKQEKLDLIINQFNNELSNGNFDSTTLGIKIDCRRNLNKNDLQNVQGLISNMTRYSIQSINYIGYTEIAVATVEKLTSLANEMEDHVLGLYQKKWQLEEQIKNVLTIESLEAITW